MRKLKRPFVVEKQSVPAPVALELGVSVVMAVSQTNIFYSRWTALSTEDFSVAVKYASEFADNPLFSISQFPFG